MERSSSPAGRVLSSSDAQGRSPSSTRPQHRTTTSDEGDALDALDARVGQPQNDPEPLSPTAIASDAGIAFRFPPPADGRMTGDDASAAAAAGRGADLSETSADPHPRPESLATTVVSAPTGFIPTSRPSGSHSGKMRFLVLLAGFAAFTDLFLSGLVIPLLPEVLMTRAIVPHQQVQIWISVLVSAHGGAFAVVSPLIPLLTRPGLASFGILFGGLTCAAAAFMLLQFSWSLPLFILGRALQGLSAAAITGATSGMQAAAVAAGTPGNRDSAAGHTWLTPAVTQSLAMATAPFLAGALRDRYGLDAVFYCAYALVTLSFALGLVAVMTGAAHHISTDEAGERILERETQQGGYGTMSSGPAESREVSPTAPVPAAPGTRDAPTAHLEATVWSPRLLIAMAGYLVVGLLTSALHSVLPLLVWTHFHWAGSATGFMFVPLSAPAAIIGPLAGALAYRAPRSIRLLATIGFLACLPSFLYLGHLRQETSLTQLAFLLTLGGFSLAMGLCGDPLIKEIGQAVGFTAGDSWSAPAQSATLPNLANAWGTLVGPLFAGAISWLWGWEVLTRLLGLVAAVTGVASLFFLQGWIGNPYPEGRSHHAEPGTDEESAPLLANDRSARNLLLHANEYTTAKEACYKRQDSDDVSPHTRIGSGGGGGADRKTRTHRRHFSVDNFSIATTAGPGSLDSSASSVRFQAALETPVHGDASDTNNPYQPQRAPSTAGSASGSGGERRYVMREAPHAPATDPLLAAGSLYVIDEERQRGAGGNGAESGNSGGGNVVRQRQKRRVVVFAEGSAPEELLARHRHHVVAINALDGTARMVSGEEGRAGEDCAVHVTEEEGEGEGEGFAEGEGTVRRYVVVVVEGEDGEDGVETGR